MTVKAIWGQTPAGVIGLRGVMPWNVPEDLVNFRKSTMGSTVVMGRKTWDSIPARFRPLKGRRNLVLTRDVNWSDEGAVAVHSVAEAVEESSKTEHGVDGVLWVMGGSEVYNLFLPYTDEIVLTVVHADVAGDAYAPAVPDTFSAVSSSKRLTSSSGLLYEFVYLERAAGVVRLAGASESAASAVDSTSFNVASSRELKRDLSDPAVQRAIWAEVRTKAHESSSDSEKSRIETSPGGVGFLRSSAKKDIPGEPDVARTAKRRSWLRK